MNRSLQALSLTACLCAFLFGAGETFAAEGAAKEEADHSVHETVDTVRAHAGEAADAGDGNGSHEGGGDHEDEAHAEDEHHEDGDENGHSAADWETERQPMPFEVVRSLQYLQDQAARGNKTALKVQRRLLKWFGPSLPSRPREIWKDKRNVRAAVLYVLSGGPAEPLEFLSRTGAFEADDQPIVEGAIAYAANRYAEAEAKLSAIDLTHEETIFAAQINLTLAQLREPNDPEEALRLLEHVMLAAPGTLLDEAALRLGVLLAENAGKTEKADRYARQYFDRYAASVYAGNFRARFSAVYSDRPVGSETETLETLSDTLRLLPDDQKVAMYLSVARRALVGGNLALSGGASQKALAFLDAEPSERQRALLYNVASTLSGRDQGEILATLSAIDDTLLHPADKALKDAALDVVAAIREPALVASGADADALDEDNQTLQRAASLIEAIDNDLKSFAP